MLYASQPVNICLTSVGDMSFISHRQRNCVRKCKASIIIIIMTYLAPISSKIKLSGAKKPRD